MSGRLGTFLVIAGLLLAAAAGATWFNYGSFDPCDWAEIDMAETTGWPRLAAKAELRARLLLDGIAEPDTHACLMAWWDVRANGTGAARTQ